MSNQPQSRPWFRLATMARAAQSQPPPPTAAQPPQTRTQTPATTTQTQPPLPVSRPPTSLKPAAPVTQPLSRPSPLKLFLKSPLPTTLPSPTVVLKSKVASFPIPNSSPPKQPSYGSAKPLPESPLKLEPEVKIPQEPEKKTAVQETVGMPKSVKSKGKDGVIVRITGENRGAVMELGCPLRGYHKIVSDEEGRAKAVNAFMNSNVQGVNSSILVNSCCSQHDPGIHFSLSRNLRNGSARLKGSHANARKNGNGF